MVDPSQLAEHVKDAPYFELPLGIEIALPKVLGLQLTKFMVLELVAAVLMIVIFVPLSRKIARGGPPKGRFWNMFEAMLVFIRDEMVRPAVGHHDADRFVPLIWTIFFFILFCNLLGLLPWAGSPTGSISVTGAMALIAFATVIGAGMKRFGPVRFWLGLVPHMELPRGMGFIFNLGILLIEVLGLLIKHSILAIRLLANMFAGHLVLAVVLGFVVTSAPTALWYGVMPTAVLGATALNLLELFVAFLQAYIFAFLASLFIGMAIHQH
jgi:F-type H+-transporting ATPase subunit a